MYVPDYPMQPEQSNRDAQPIIIENATLQPMVEVPVIAPKPTHALSTNVRLNRGILAVVTGREGATVEMFAYVKSVANELVDALFTGIPPVKKEAPDFTPSQHSDSCINLWIKSDIPVKFNGILRYVTLNQLNERSTAAAAYATVMDMLSVFDAPNQGGRNAD